MHSNWTLSDEDMFINALTDDIDPCFIKLFTACFSPSEVCRIIIA